MKVELIAYGIARDILKTDRLEFEMNTGNSIAMLKQQLFEMYPSFRALASVKFAVGEEYQDDSFVLEDNQEVVIIPPVAGG